MSYSDPLTPQAFSLALLQSEPSEPLLSQELQQLRQRIRAAIQQNSPNLDAAIRAYLQKDQPLKQQYDLAYDQLERQTHAQERTKFRRTNGSQTNGHSAAITWQDIATPILTADADLETVKLQLRPYKTRISAASPQTQIYWSQVQQAITAQEAKELAILQAIETHPLTIQDLAYRINLPPNAASATVQNLWRQGYLDRTTAPLLQILWPHRRHRHQPLSPDTALALTAKGYFRLHPLLQPSRSKSA